MKRRTIVTILAAMGLSFCVIWVLTNKWMADGVYPQANGTNEYAIILGAKVNGETPSLSLKYRLDAAIQYAELYPDVQFILSGGQGHDEDISEAEAMHRYLTEHGINSDRLIMEEQSTSTYENILFSKQLLDDTVSSITIISNDFHLYRAQYIAKKLELQTDVVAAKTPKIVESKSRFRERLALIKTIIVGK